MEIGNVQIVKKFMPIVITSLLNFLKNIDKKLTLKEDGIKRIPGDVPGTFRGHNSRTPDLSSDSPRV